LHFHYLPFVSFWPFRSQTKEIIYNLQYHGDQTFKSLLCHRIFLKLFLCVSSYISLLNSLISFHYIENIGISKLYKSTLSIKCLVGMFNALYYNTSQYINQYQCSICINPFPSQMINICVQIHACSKFSMC